jgi:hypothetical protein
MGLRKITPIRSPQKLPDTAPYGSRVDELVQLDRAGLRLHGNHGIADRDQIFLLQLEQALPHSSAFASDG